MLILNKKPWYASLSFLSFDFIIILYDGLSLDNVDSYKYHGLWIDPDLTFKPHIDYILLLAFTLSLNQLSYI